MNPSTFQRLLRIRDEFGPGVFGKIAQKLLALAFYESGAQHIVERAVQGADLDVVTRDGAKYALEVKTTQGESVPISEDNINALRDRAKDGYTAVIPVLRMRMFEDWVFAAIPLSRLQPGSLPWYRLRAYRLGRLERSIRPTFERVVTQHFDNVLAAGERYLKEVLDQKRAKLVSR